MIGLRPSIAAIGSQAITKVTVTWDVGADGRRIATLTQGAVTRPVGFAPQPGGQTAFLSCPLREALGEGNRFGGKSYALIADFLKDCGKGYGAAWRGIILRRESVRLKDIVLKSHEMIPRIWPDACFVASPGATHWRFRSGERLFFLHANRLEEYQKFHGWSYPWLGFDELTEWPDDRLYRKIHSILRAPEGADPRVGRIKRIRATTNPGGPGHSWVKERFGLPIRDGHTIGSIIREDVDDGATMPRCAIHMDRSENVIGMSADPDYESTLRGAASSDAELQAWVYGNWNIVAGGFLDDVWRPRHNIIDPFPVPSTWRISRSFDWGSSDPFCVLWFAESDGSDARLADGSTMPTIRGDAFVVDEWYGWNGRPNDGCRLLNEAISAGIVERQLAAGWHSRVRPGPADTQIWNVISGTSIADEMARPLKLNGVSMPGVQWIRADKSPGSRVAGGHMVRSRIRAAYPLDGSNGREKPGLFFFSNATHCIRTLPVLPRDPVRINDADTKAEDHAYDALRYWVQSSPARVTSGRTIGHY